MGRDSRQATIAASVSDCNSEQDDIDEKLWEELLAEVRRIVRQPKYEPIRADLY